MSVTVDQVTGRNPSDGGNIPNLPSSIMNQFGGMKFSKSINNRQKLSDDRNHFTLSFLDDDLEERYYNISFRIFKIKILIFCVCVLFLSAFLTIAYIYMYGFEYAFYKKITNFLFGLFAFSIISLQFIHCCLDCVCWYSCFLPSGFLHYNGYCMYELGVMYVFFLIFFAFTMSSSPNKLASNLPSYMLLIFMFIQPRVRYFLSYSIVLSYVIFLFTILTLTNEKYDPMVQINFLYHEICSFVVVYVYIYIEESQRRKGFFQTQLLEVKERELIFHIRTSNDLIMNIFPNFLLTKIDLSKNLKYFESFPEMIYFVTDFVGFTNYCTHEDPKLLIGYLNKIYVLFDTSLEKYVSLEKTKTIGDAYCVCCNPFNEEARRIDALGACLLGIDLQKDVLTFNEQEGKSFKMRVGIGCNRGSIVLFGNSRLTLDVLGPVAEETNLLEMSCPVGEVQVHQKIRTLVGDKDVFVDDDHILVFRRGSSDSNCSSTNNGGHTVRILPITSPIPSHIPSPMPSDSGSDEEGSCVSDQSDHVSNPVDHFSFYEGPFQNFTETDNGRRMSVCSVQSSAASTKESIRSYLSSSEYSRSSSDHSSEAESEFEIKSFEKGILHSITKKNRVEWYSYILQIFLCSFRRQVDFLKFSIPSTLPIVVIVSLFLSFSYVMRIFVIVLFDIHLNPGEIWTCTISGVAMAGLQFLFIIIYFASRKKPKLFVLVYVIHIVSSILYSIFFMGIHFDFFLNFRFSHASSYGSLAYLVPILPSYINFFGSIFMALSFNFFRIHYSNQIEYIDEIERRTISSDIYFLPLMSLLFAASSYVQMIKMIRLFSQKCVLEEKLEAIKEKVEMNNTLLLSVLPRRLVDLTFSNKLSYTDVVKMNQDFCSLKCCVGFINIGDILEILPAEEAVSILNPLYNYIDDTLDYFQVEKIKVISSYYLFYSCEKHNSIHYISNAFFFSLFIINQFCNLEKYKKFKIKIGLHCGRSTFGIVGKSKFLWDIFGDTANMASRLSSTAEYGTFHVSNEIRLKMKDYRDSIPPEVFNSENDIKEKGMTYIKGKGDVLTYIVIRESFPTSRILLYSEKIVKGEGRINPALLEDYDDAMC